MKEYQPFTYPPDYELAKIHQQASKPGKVQVNKNTQCPCCNQVTKQPLKSWINRSIDHDFKSFGGAVVTYFWLVKLYAFVSLVVLVIYSSYLIASIHNNCSFQFECQKFMGIWIVSNQNLFKILMIKDEKQAITRIYTLRTMAYIVLLVGNLMALYISGRFKRRYPQPKNISSFSLIFKNVVNSPENFIKQLTDKFPNVQIHQIFNIKKLQPFYSLYNQKLQVYYLSLIEQDLKKKKRLLQRLQVLQKKCFKQQQNYEISSDRVIVVFKNQQQKLLVQQQYELKGFDRVKYIVGFDYRQQAYCQKCPLPSQIIWNNIGSNQSQKMKMKMLSIAYFTLLLAGSYLCLSFCMHLVYNRQVLPSPWNVIVANIIMTLLVPIALTFRQLMNKLAEMRRPNTQTNRTMFIVLTTVLFHLIYYIMIPTFYLKLSERTDQNKVLFIITNQTFNFLLVQFVLAYLDFVYCTWNRKLKNVYDQSKPIGCQKILHEKIQYPRFPIQFKLIILFKTFSFIILFAFESPLIMFFCFALLIFLYVTDKYSVYRHYRMEFIQNGVQFKFLKVYSVFFSVYTFLIYSLTQHFEQIKTEYYISLLLMVLLVIVQVFFLRDRVFQDETIQPSTLQQEKITDSYKLRFNKFKQNVINTQIDFEIKSYLTKSGYYSLQTEQTNERSKYLLQQ